MSSILAPLALSVSTGALLALPLAPALRELFSKRDAGPLVTREDDGRIDNFAKSLRARCETFDPWLSSSADRENDEAIDLPDGLLFVTREEGPWRGPAQTDLPVLCAHRVELPDGFNALDDFYGRQGIDSGRNNVFRALLSDDDIELNAGSQILRWIHAAGDLIAGNDCILFGRASAGRSMTLSPGCKFERIHSPIIYSSAAAAELDVKPEAAPFSKLAQAGIGRTRVQGQLQIAAGEQRRGDIVATRGLSIEERGCVFGSVKGNGDASLHPLVEVHGSLVSTRRIHIAKGCFIQGPVIAEQEIFIDSGVQIGMPASPTTVTAPIIRISPGAVLHGTVWARVEGRVGD